MKIKLNRFFWGILFFVAAAAGHARAQSADNNDAQIAALKQQLRMMDPQPFHLDEAAARRSLFGVLTASGWHTAAVTMRLLWLGANSSQLADSWATRLCWCMS